MTGYLHRRTLLAAALSAVTLPALPAFAASQKTGVLILAHGLHATPVPDAKAKEHAGHDDHANHANHAPPPPNPWHANIEAIVAGLDKTWPTTVAFGMAEFPAIQDAVTRLEKRGVAHIAVAPLFVSSHSPIIGNSRYILGLQDKLGRNTSLKELPRVKTKATFSMSGALDAHPLVSEILVDRAKAKAKDPSKTNVVLIAHGPNDEDDNRMWLKDMETHATYLKKAGFRSAEVLTHRNDAPPEIKSAARAAFRARVETAGKNGMTVVVPLLISRGGIEKEVERDLAGLPHVFADPLAPHPNLEKWVREQVKMLAK